MDIHDCEYDFSDLARFLASALYTPDTFANLLCDVLRTHDTSCYVIRALVHVHGISPDLCDLLVKHASRDLNGPAHIIVFLKFLSLDVADKLEFLNTHAPKVNEFSRRLYDTPAAECAADMYRLVNNDTLNDLVDTDTHPRPDRFVNMTDPDFHNNYVVHTVFNFYNHFHAMHIAFRFLFFLSEHPTPIHVPECVCDFEAQFVHRVLQNAPRHRAVLHFFRTGTYVLLDACDDLPNENSEFGVRALMARLTRPYIDVHRFLKSSRYDTIYPTDTFRIYTDSNPGYARARKSVQTQVMRHRNLVHVARVLDTSKTYDYASAGICEDTWTAFVAFLKNFLDSHAFTDIDMAFMMSDGMRRWRTLCI